MDARELVSDGHVLETERLTLQPLCPGDAHELFELLNDQRLHQFTGGLPLTHEELCQRYQRLVVVGSSDGNELWLNWVLRLRSGHHAVGTVQATVVSKERHASMAWVIGARWQRQGYAQEAATEMRRHLEQSGIRSVSANIHPHHVASQKVARRVGLKLTDRVVDGEQVWHLEFRRSNQVASATLL